MLSKQQSAKRGKLWQIKSMIRKNHSTSENNFNEIDTATQLKPLLEVYDPKQRVLRLIDAIYERGEESLMESFPSESGYFTSR